MCVCNSTLKCLDGRGHECKSRYASTIRIPLFDSIDSGSSRHLKARATLFPALHYPILSTSFTRILPTTVRASIQPSVPHISLHPEGRQEGRENPLAP